MDTLAVRLTIPPVGLVGDFHSLVNAPCRAHKEKHRRQLVGVLALQWGRGAIALLSAITGLSRNTIRRGRQEVQRLAPRSELHRVRHAGGGRQKVEKKRRRC